MSTPKEYREYAKEALESAERATTEGERKAFESLACKWIEAAIATSGLWLSPSSSRP